MADQRFAEAAQFILDEVKSGNRVFQSRVVRHIREQWGEDLSYKNKNGNWALVQPILEEFLRISGNDVVWSRSDQAWRLRKETDKPGRMQR